MDQISIFDLTMPMVKIEKKIRLIELFAGYGSQAMALDEICADYEHWKVVEFDKYAVQSYNAVHGTSFEVTDIRDVKGSDLEITSTDIYTYFMTYSFPCTDLSVAGKMKGMKKGSGTRSGLLWEVERLLTEIFDTGGELPQVLFMENVPQVISEQNISDFHDWQFFLERIGYTNYVSVLNARDYGVAQNRERCFMFSFLGEVNYKFPEPIPLTKTMKDYLEDEVEEKYYINTEKAQKLVTQLFENGNLQGYIGNVNPSGNGLNGNVYFGDIAPTLTTNKGEGQKICVDTKMILELGNIAEESGFSNPQTGRVYSSNGCVPTINTCGGGNHEPKTIVAMRGKNPENYSETTVKIKQATKEGYIECKIGGVADLPYPNSGTRRGRVQENGEVSPTITATETGICRIESMYRIRKLIPRECGRLMHVSDKNIDRILSVVSNSQAYKQFGNSIVVLVMVAMFSNLHIQGLPTWREISKNYI